MTTPETTNVMTTRENTFKVLHPNNNYLQINIIIKELNYNSEGCKYDISLSYLFDEKIAYSSRTNYIKYLNLFDDDGNYYGGDIIHKNELTEKLVEYLLMTDEELQKYSGRITSDCYRINLIQSINLFWD